MVRRVRGGLSSLSMSPSSVLRHALVIMAFFVDLVRYGVVLGLASTASSTGAGINVALHAQVPPSSEMVVGSAVTMAGVRQALLRRHGKMHAAGESKIDGVQQGSTTKIAHAEIFYPFTYDGLHERQWDLVIIEGWFKMINVFIHEVWAGSSSKSWSRTNGSTCTQTSASATRSMRTRSTPKSGNRYGRATNAYLRRHLTIVVAVPPWTEVLYLHWGTCCARPRERSESRKLASIS